MSQPDGVDDPHCDECGRPICSRNEKMRCRQCLDIYEPSLHQIYEVECPAIREEWSNYRWLKEARNRQRWEVRQYATPNLRSR